MAKPYAAPQVKSAPTTVGPIVSSPVSRSYRVEREGAYWMLYGVDVTTHTDGRVTVTEKRLEGAPNMRAIIERRLIDFALDERLDPRLK